MLSCYPSDVELENDQNILATKLVDSLAGLIGFTSPHTVDCARQLLLSLGQQYGYSAHGLLHPILFAYYHRLLFDDKIVNLERLESLVLPFVIKSIQSAKNSFENLGILVDLNNNALASAPIRQRLEITAKKAQPEDHLLMVLAMSDDKIQKFHAAIQIILRVWPEMAKEILCSISCVSLFEANYAIGAADVCVHGALFFNQVKFDLEPVKLAEEIIHESSHVRLNCRLSIDNFIENNPSESYSSPLRKDKRPMFGIIHQIFVLSRLRQYYIRCSSELDSTYQQDVDNITKLLSTGLEVARRHAVLSESGKVLLGSVVESL